MSYSVDVNVLLYSSYDENPFHLQARDFLTACVSSREETFCLGWPTLMAYLRMSTNRRLFSRPLSARTAEENVSSLIAQPHVRLLSESGDFWRTYRDLTEEAPIQGDLVPDAHLAALLIEHEVPVLYTNDSDFSRFSKIEVRNPFSGT